ncbi:hypothetical protein KUTeg_010334 [Tegillarca granosa]|uniref:Uncharacterized protein n=1 Tax=Tegillarca granosa TaxID=220873 RepID=A0ABQ9F8M3_TEGGR|nr:hypothetical protein KUTeg_010334 [Tegillarca granosa]
MTLPCLNRDLTVDRFIVLMFRYLKRPNGLLFQMIVSKQIDSLIPPRLTRHTLAHQNGKCFDIINSVKMALMNFEDLCRSGRIKKKSRQH